MTRITEPPAAEAINRDFYDPYGLTDGTGRAAMRIRRYVHEYGIDEDKLGWITTVCREHGAKNPNSIFYNQPATIEDYRKSAMIAEPIREMDCSPEIDGAIAFVITTVERAKRLRQQPVYITAGAQSMATGTYMMTSYYRPTISGLPEMENVKKRLFEQAGITHKDISLVELDDIFAPFVPIQLEELGFCGKGEGADFCEGGDRIRLGGELPLNTGGGSLGEGNIYGLNHIHDAVMQLRGTAPNQVKDAEIALVTTGAGGPASGLILRK
jgi:acetyl-CoA acetyltransferase